MQATNFSLEKYCKRIGYKGELQPNDITLLLLMRHQLMTVPLKI
jgi:N-hydroxyarylamine O-acetyltransferase